MPSRRRLDGRRLAALVADGFEKVELIVPLRALQKAGAEVDVVSLRRGRIRGVNLHMPASRVRVDRTIDQADPGAYDGLLLPGGFINPDLLRQSAQAREFVRAFAASDKPIATLCHGPWVLASAGLVGGRTLTSWPGIRDDLVNAGATWLDQELVRDGNLITSRGPQDMAAFVPGILDAFATTSPEPATAAPRRESDPQRDAPVGWAIAALRWSPKPSAAAVLGIAVAAAAQRALSAPAGQTWRSRAGGRAR
ncbi:MULTISPECIES: type 1 glutamine amidotransferase domain-containing protein [unclassified Blastococcus]